MSRLRQRATGNASRARSAPGLAAATDSGTAGSEVVLADAHCASVIPALPRSAVPVTERSFQRQVEQLLKLYGWRFYHTHDSRRSIPGFPDLIAVRGHLMLALELKVGTAKPTAEQVEWLTALDKVYGCTALVVRYSRDMSQLEALLSEADLPDLPFAW